MVINKKDNKRVLEAIRKGVIDTMDLSFLNLIDAMIFNMERGSIIYEKNY
jgi:hypothetical protein